VVCHWDDLCLFTSNSKGDIFESSAEYEQQMMQPHTYGALSEVKAAAELYRICIQVFQNCTLLAMFGGVEDPVKRLRFTGDLSNGHYDAYIHSEDLQMANFHPQNTLLAQNRPTKRSSRVSDRIRLKKLKTSSDKYQDDNTDVNQAAIAKNHAKIFRAGNVIMSTDCLSIDGEMKPHSVIPITGDGACLFRSISYVLNGTQEFFGNIRQEIVRHIVLNWDDLSSLTSNSKGDIFESAAEYERVMLKPHTYGAAAEISAAATLYQIRIEVFANGKLMALFGRDEYPIKRLRFSGNMSNGHYDVYMALENLQTTSDTSKSTSSTQKRPIKRARVSNRIRNKQLRIASKNYKTAHPETQQAAVAKYQAKHPEVHQAASAKYQAKNPTARTERRLRPWKIKTNSASNYDPDTAYNIDAFITLGKMDKKCKFCCALKWKGESKGICCKEGKVKLPSLKVLPEPLKSLILGDHPSHAHFMDCIRKYNNCFQMTSFGKTKIIREGNFMPAFKVQGQVYHMFGSPWPYSDCKEKFFQIHFVGEDEKEATLVSTYNSHIRPDLIRKLQSMLYKCISYIRDIKAALQKVPKDCKDYKMVIHADKKSAGAHKGRFNASEVALVIVGQQS